MSQWYVRVFTGTLLALLLQLVICMVPNLPSQLSNEAQAANGQCVWEGGSGLAESCKAEDCKEDGGNATCTAGVGAANTPWTDSQLEPDKWEYQMCPVAESYPPAWCVAAGGTVSSTCINTPSDVLGGWGTITSNEGKSTSISDAYVSRIYSTCSVTSQSDSGWGVTVPDGTGCYIGSTINKLQTPTRQLKTRTYSISGGSCTQAITFEIVIGRFRDAKCPAGYKSRTRSDNRQECYLPLECCEARQGNPVSAISGSKFQEENDYSSPVADGISFSRFYKSTGYFRIPSLSVLPGPLENMQMTDFWHDNYDSHMYVLSGNIHLMAIQQQADGSLRSFDLSGKEMASRGSAAATLTTVANGFDLALANSDVEHYDTGGNLSSITHRSGLVTNLAYTNGLLSSVSDSFGHTLTLTYTNGRLTTVTLPDSGVVTYGYDGYGRLASVTYPDSAIRQYQYGDARNQWLLTGITDENGQQFATYTYDANGAVVAESHAGGAESYSFTYGASSTTMSDPLGTTTQLGFTPSAGVIRMASYSRPCATCGGYSNITYDSAGNPASKTDFNGNQTTYVYDTTRNLETSRTEAYGTVNARTTTTQWHAIYNQPALISVYAGNSVTGTPIKTTVFSYDGQGNLLNKTETDPATDASRTWSYTYNSYGQILTVNGPRTDVNDVTTYTYYTCNSGYQCGQVNTITNAAGQTTTYNTYNANGQPLTITDANGLVTTLAYDTRQRLISRIVDSESMSFDYWPTGLLKKVTLPDGSYLSYTYDAAHRLTAITDSAGNSTQYTLDAMGNHTNESTYDVNDTLVLTRSKVYDVLGHVYQEIGAANQTTTYSYDNDGNMLSTLDANSNYTQNNYDALNRLSSVTDPASQLTQYGYDNDDDLISVTDPKNLITSYAYSGLGDLSQQSSPDTGNTNDTYDSAGNLKTSTDANGNTVTYSYDVLNRITQAAYADQTINYTYDQNINGKGHLTSLTDASGSTGFSYTAEGRIANKTQITGSITKSIGYSYNAAGQLTQLTTPTGQAITYTYSNGKVNSISVNGTPLISQISYAAFGAITGWQWSNGTTTSRQYNTDGQLTQLSSAGDTTDYTYNPDGSIASVADDNEVIPTFTSGQDLFTNASTSNKLNSISGALMRNYTYDADGHTLSDGTRSFTYNAAGRMITATNAGITTSYSYNALGQRVEKSNSNGTTYFVYDEAGHLLSELDGSGNLVEELVYLNDIPVATIRTDQTGGSVGVFYIHTDHLNAPTKITRPSDNQIIWRFDHDPYGNGVPNEDPDGNGLSLKFNLRFAGQYADEETGLYYNWNRYFDPIGRYISSDPTGLYGGQANTYAYANGNPVSYVDFDGLEPAPNLSPQVPNMTPPRIGPMPGNLPAPANEPPPETGPATVVDLCIANPAACAAAIIGMGWPSSIGEDFPRPKNMTRPQQRAWDRYCEKSNNRCGDLKAAVRQAINQARVKMNNMLTDKGKLFPGLGWKNHAGDLAGRIASIEAMISLGELMDCDMTEERVLAKQLYLPLRPL